MTHATCLPTDEDIAIRLDRAAMKSAPALRSSNDELDDDMQRVADQYEHDCRTGRESDWCWFDSNRSSELLFRLNKILRDRSYSAIDQALECREEINKLIEHCAATHARIWNENGRP